MNESNKPFMSIVIPVYNGDVTIGRALKSLLAQDYPSENYEIIVVNDGSTDRTTQVVANFSAVRNIELPYNMGIPFAQNAGLEAAKGDIYVAFNDDFQAAPDFLSNLALGYAELADPMGIGGIVVKQKSRNTTGLVASYMEASHAGAAPDVISIRPAFIPVIIKRLLTYIVSNFRVGRYVDLDDRGHQEVVELYGANASFPISMLRKIGGWDTSTAAPAIGGIEDRDICLRMRQHFPNHHFYVINSAHIMSDLDPRDSAISIRSYLARPYRRGPFNYAFHIKNGLAPQLFPFPPLILVILLTNAALAPPLLLPFLVALLPQIFYVWWAQRAIAEHRLMYLLFPYLQAAEETMVLAGFLRGFAIHTKKRYVKN